MPEEGVDPAIVGLDWWYRKRRWGSGGKRLFRSRWVGYLTQTWQMWRWI